MGALAVRVPASEIAADARETLHRHDGLRGIVDGDDRGLRPDHRDIDHEDVVVHFSQRPVAVGRDENLGRVARCRVLRAIVGIPRDAQMLLAIRAVESHRHEALLPLRQVDALVIAAREVGIADADAAESPRADGRDGRNGAAGRGKPDQLSAIQLLLLETRLPGRPVRDDPLPVGRVIHVGVERGLPRQLFRRAVPGHRNPIDVSTLLGPRHVGDVAAIRRPHRMMLSDFVCRAREPTRRTGRDIHDPELIERGERQAPSVGRRARAANLRDGERRVVDRIVELR
jgi:hypothetical protein